MGLDMYLYRATKKDFADRKNFYAKENAFYKKWDDILGGFPVKDNGWEIDESRLTESQKTDYSNFLREQKVLEDGKPAIVESREIFYWRKFNALHGFIVDTFANGVDECQTIEIGKAGVAKIVSALRETARMLKAKHGLDPTKLPVKPVGGFFFGSTEIDDYYKRNIEEALEMFDNLLASLSDEETVFYEASW